MIPSNAIVRIALASLSCFGSTTIAAMICRAGMEGLRKSPYSRIVFGLSISDILLSASIIASIFAVPKSITDSNWVVGTNGSCEAVVFTIIAGNMAVLFYTVFLTFYFLLRVKFSMTPQAFTERFEYKIHALIWFFALGGALFGLIRKDYNPYAEFDISSHHGQKEGDSSYMCMIVDFPENCVLNPETYGPCIRGEHAITDVLIVIAMPTALTFVALVVILCLFTSHIHNQESLLTAPPVVASSSQLGAQRSSRSGSAVNDVDVSGSAIAIGNGHEHEYEHEHERLPPDDISCWWAIIKKSPCFRCTTSAGLRSQQATAMTTTNAITSTSTSTRIVTYTSDEEGRRRLGILAKKSLVQSSLYIVVFVACYFFPMVLFFVSNYIKSEMVSRILIFSGNSVFWPLGGFLNIIVYTRPKVSKFKRDNPQYVDFPWVFIFIAVVCCGGEVPEIDVEEVIPSSELGRRNANANANANDDRDNVYYLDPYYPTTNNNNDDEEGNGNGNGNEVTSGNGSGSGGKCEGSHDEGNDNESKPQQQQQPTKYSTPFVTAPKCDKSNPSRMQYSTPFVKAPPQHEESELENICSNAGTEEFNESLL